MSALYSITSDDISLLKKFAWELIKDGFEEIGKDTPDDGINTYLHVFETASFAFNSWPGNWNPIEIKLTRENFIDTQVELSKLQDKDQDIICTTDSCFGLGKTNYQSDNYLL